MTSFRVGVASFRDSFPSHRSFHRHVFPFGLICSFLFFRSTELYRVFLAVVVVVVVVFVAVVVVFFLVSRRGSDLCSHWCATRCES